MSNQTIQASVLVALLIGAVALTQGTDNKREKFCKEQVSKSVKGKTRLDNQVASDMYFDCMGGNRAGD